MADPSLIVNSGPYHSVAHFLRDYWPVVLGAFGFILSILVILKSKIPVLEKRSEEILEKVRKLEDGKGQLVAKTDLFDKNDQFKFQTVPMCIDMREECHMQQSTFQADFCKKLDNISYELKGIVNDADRKREGTRHEITAMNKQLIELMTQMKTILARDRREETVDMVQMVVRQVMIQMKNDK